MGGWAVVTLSHTRYAELKQDFILLRCQPKIDHSAWAEKPDRALKPFENYWSALADDFRTFLGHNRHQSRTILEELVSDPGEAPTLRWARRIGRPRRARMGPTPILIFEVDIAGI